MEKPPPLKKPRRKFHQEEQTPLTPLTSVVKETPVFLPQLAPLEPPPQDDGKIFIGDIEVQMDSGKLICPVKLCAKHFRRENLLHVRIIFFIEFRHQTLSLFLGADP